ncbi:MAG TPA: hypothetical protein VFG50_07435 [Rhodothermales bacterium]|nr:hypothetical protein [Rhodothermales bacterium]
MRSDVAGSAIDIGKPPQNEVRRFTSTAHPTDQPLAVVFGQAVLGPLAWILLPIMLLSLVTALERASIWGFVVLCFPLGLAAATALTMYKLQGQKAVLYVAGPVAAVGTVWDVARNIGPRWHPVLDVRVAQDAVFATLSDTTHEFNRSDWADFPDLLASLVHARHSYVLELPE